MILDTLDRLKAYASISPLMEKVIAFIEGNDLGSLEPGKIVLDGEDLFVNVNVQEAQTRAEVPIEAHVKYIDIQIPVSADEEMGYVAESMLPAPSQQYSPEKDVVFYPGLCDTYLNVRKGMFVVFLPGEGHAPAITENGIRKLVIKIRL